MERALGRGLFKKDIFKQVIELCYLFLSWSTFPILHSLRLFSSATAYYLMRFTIGSVTDSNTVKLSTG